MWGSSDQGVTHLPPGRSSSGLTTRSSAAVALNSLTLGDCATRTSASCATRAAVVHGDRRSTVVTAQCFWGWVRRSRASERGPRQCRRADGTHEPFGGAEATRAAPSSVRVAPHLEHLGEEGGTPLRHATPARTHPPTHDRRPHLTLSTSARKVDVTSAACLTTTYDPSSSNGTCMVEVEVVVEAGRRGHQGTRKGTAQQRRCARAALGRKQRHGVSILRREVGGCARQRTQGRPANERETQPHVRGV